MDNRKTPNSIIYPREIIPVDSTRHDDTKPGSGQASNVFLTPVADEGSVLNLAPSYQENGLQTMTPVFPTDTPTLTYTSSSDISSFK